MTLTTFLLQAVASLLAIITFLIVLNVQRSMLLPGGILGMAVWLIYLLLKEPTNVIVATFIAAIIGSCVSQIFKYSLQDPCCGLYLGHFGPSGSGIPFLSDNCLFCDGGLQSRHC